MFNAASTQFSFHDGEGRQFARQLRGLRPFFARRVPPCDVDDLIQEVALRIHGRRDADAIENGQAYMFQVAHSVLTDRARRAQVRQRDMHFAMEESHHPIEERSPARVLEGKERLATLVEALGELPDRPRQAFVLHRFEEMSYADIARHLGVSVSAVEKYIMRAIRHLAARIDE